MRESPGVPLPADRDAQPRVRERYPELGPLLDQLDGCSDAQYEASIAFLGSEGTTAVFFTPTDMILLSFVARSLDLIDAFIDACDRWNLSVASGLVRLQVDNVIRVHLVSTHPRPRRGC